TLIGTVLGEMFAAQRGIGYLLMNAIGLYNVDVIMAVAFLLFFFAGSGNTILLAVEDHFHRRHTRRAAGRETSRGRPQMWGERPPGIDRAGEVRPLCAAPNNCRGGWRRFTSPVQRRRTAP